MARAERAIAWDKLDDLKLQLEPTLTDTLAAAAAVAIKYLPVKVDIRFDEVNPAALAWIKAHAAELVEQNIIAESKEAIRNIVRRMFEEGIPPREGAKLIREWIGLLPRDAVAVSKYRAWLRDEKGLHISDVDRLAAQYARQLLTHRAEVIARNETMIASNRGQQELWDKAIDQGLLIEEDWLRRWIVVGDERMCDLCAPMSGETAPINGQFDTGEGSIDGPPLHIQCRCVCGLVRADKEKKKP